MGGRGEELQECQSVAPGGRQRKRVRAAVGGDGRRGATPHPSKLPQSGPHASGAEGSTTNSCVTIGAWMGGRTIAGALNSGGSEGSCPRSEAALGPRGLVSTEPFVWLVEEEYSLIRLVVGITL